MLRRAQVAINWPTVRKFLEELRDEEVCGAYVAKALAMLNNAAVEGSIRRR